MNSQKISEEKVKVSERVLRIRQTLLDAVPEISSERAVLATEYYKMSESMPAALRRANMLDYILTHMKVVIRKDELIVGNHTEKLRQGAIFFPECSADWIENDIDNFPVREQDPFVVTDQVRKELFDILPYWKGRTLSDCIGQLVPEEEKLAAKYAVSHVTYSDGTGHLLVDYEAVTGKGIQGIIQEINDRKEQLDIQKVGDYNKKMYLDSQIIALKAIIKFANRFAEEAENQAAVSTDEKRKKELLKISEICRNVPEKPAKSFQEALQSVWFVNLVLQIETNGTGVSIGRLDQIIYPYYKMSMEAGEITQAEAQEILDCFWMKFEEINKVRNSEIVGCYSGYLTNQSITLGGVDSHGRDVTNAITYMCLESQKSVYLRSPQLAIRVHNNTPYKLLNKAVEVIRMGGGLPQLIGDNAVIQSLVRLGIPLQEARNYANVGCVEPSVVGGWGVHKGGAMNLPKIADLAISNGIDRLSGVQVGCQSGKPEDLKTMEDFLNAVHAQLTYFVNIATMVYANIVEPNRAAIVPHVFTSALVPGCTEKCMDATMGGAKYNWTGVNMSGAANYGNIIAAVQKVVYEDKVCTLQELNEALNKNFEGYEDLRYELMNAPKYGNDDDYVDLILARELEHVAYEYEKHSTMRGGKFSIGCFPGTMNHHFGEHSGATADGRMALEPFADGISPSPGTDKNGPTAVMNSLTKVDLSLLGNGAVLNMKFSPQLFNTEKGIRDFIGMNKVYLALQNGYHIQFNVVSKDTLLQAQKDPKKYRDLIVRVTGYSAYFTELGKGVQDQIISRTEQHMY